MSWLRATLQAASGWSGIDDRWYQPIGQKTASGITVSPQSALSSSPVWAGVNIKSGILASLPLLIYRRRNDGGKDRAPYTTVYQMFHTAVNPLQTPFQFVKLMEVWRILWGACYAEIIRNGDGFVTELWPLHPDGVRADKQGRDVRYMVRQPSGQDAPYPRERIFHLPGLTLDGTNGLSLIQYARESIALNMSARDYSSSFMREGGRPSGVLTHPGKLTPAGRTHMREEWELIHGGAANAHKVAILQEGVQWAATGMTAEDAQLIGLLEWSVEDIARFLGVPLHMLQETSKVTSWGSGIEELSHGFVTYNLMPDLVLWQQSVTQDLLPALPNGAATATVPTDFFAEFVFDALLRGKTLERFQAYQIATGGAPWMAPNEVRGRENQNPLPGGDEIQKPDPIAAPAPRPPAAPPSNQPRPPHGLAEALAQDTAARIVRREQAAFNRPNWSDQLAEMSTEHAGFVAGALHIPKAAANKYVAYLVTEVAEGGPVAAANTETARVEYLTALALEAQA